MWHNEEEPDNYRLLYNMSAAGGLRRNYNDRIRKDPDDDARSVYEEQMYL